jgi:hypothetical protein
MFFYIHSVPFTMFWHKGRLEFHFLTLDTCLISVISVATKVPDIKVNVTCCQIYRNHN